MTEWIVTSSALILIVIALRGLLKGKISLKLQYALWALVLVRLLLPFSLVESAISVSNLLSVPVIQEADDAVADYRESYESVRNDYAQRGEDVSTESLRQQVQQELFDRTYQELEQEYAQSGAVVTETQLQTQAQQQVEVISLTAVVTEALPYLWIGGMIAVGAALIGSNLHFAWNLYKSRKPLDVPGVPLKVHLTDYVATPCLFGFLLPDIYLTREVMEDSKMRSHVLAHEMSHYRQGDHIWSALRCVCLVLHWYNPLVWAAVILSKQDAELACDEATIQYLGEAERVAYGRTLIGMTCVRRDPRSLMLTATTMLGTKKTLKERVMLIAKKPKTALYTLIACVLVAAVAVGCTFTGAPSEPTEPTSPDDAVWEQLKEAVNVTNSAESRHLSLYLLPEHPGKVDLGGVTPAGECWVYGDDFYLVYNTEPSQLYYEGTYYAHISDNTWLVDRYPDDDEYGYDVSLPSRSAYTMTWTQTGEYLDVALQSNTDEYDSFHYRMDSNGKLLWYASTFQGSVIDGDGVQTIAKLYMVYVFHDTAPTDVREKIETAAEEILSTMVEWDGEPPTKPAIVPSEQDSLMLLEQCRLALEELQSRDSFELIQEMSSNSPDALLRFEKAQYIHNGNDWIHINESADFTKMYLQDGTHQYVKYITSAIPEEDRVYTTWTEVDLDNNPFAAHCWLMIFQWSEESIEFHKEESNGDVQEIFVYVNYEDGTRELMSFRFRIGDFTLLSVTRIYDDDAGNIISNKVSIADSAPEEHTATILQYLHEVQIEKAEDLILIDQFQQLLKENYWYRSAIGCIFEEPAEISVYYLLYNGLPADERQDYTEFADNEVAFLKDVAVNSTWKDESVWVNAHKMPRQYIDDMLNDYFGISIEDVVIPEEWSYFAETDSYYYIRSDAYGVNGYTVTDVQTDDNGLIYVYWTTNYILDTRVEETLFIDQPQMVTVLQEKVDGGYLVLSNLPVEE